MTPLQVGILGCVVLVALLFTSMPVAFAMIAAGVAGFALIVTPHAAFSMVVADLYDTFASYSLTVIPLFVFMGQVAFHAGISRRLFRTAYTWIGHLPGGLAMATVGACAGFGAICGSGPATAATMASVALPERRRYNYSDELSSGSVAAGGSLGMLIPPSVVFIVYALMTEQSIGALFLAGIVPGILIAVLFCLSIYVRCRVHKSLGPAGPKATWRERLFSLTGVLETLILFVAVIGGMFLGLFTPIEAAAVGAAGSLVVALVKRQLNLERMRRILLETVRTSAMVFFIVAGAAWCRLQRGRRAVRAQAVGGWCSSGTISTGQGALRAILSVVLPKKMVLKRLEPWRPMTIRSAFSASAASRIFSLTPPTAYRTDHPIPLGMRDR